MDTEQKLEELARMLYAAKKNEEAAKADRIAIEEQILSLVDVADNSSKTVKAGDLKITLKRELSYSVEETALFSSGIASHTLEVVFDRIPETFKFNPRSYESLREADPAAFAEVSKYVATKPKKPSVTLKL
jgi:hypothetical protein